MEAVKEALQCKSLHLCGLHCHIGSQILDTNGFEAAAEVMMQFIATIQKELHVTIEELNLGGGFGICYTEQDDPIPYEQYMEAVSKVIHRCSEEYGVPQPFILIEPGRSIVAQPTLYSVSVCL